MKPTLQLSHPSNDYQYTTRQSSIFESLASSSFNYELQYYVLIKNRSHYVISQSFFGWVSKIATNGYQAHVLNNKWLIFLE